MDIEIQNRKYCHEARDSDFHFIPLHALFGGRWWRRWRSTSLIKKSMLGLKLDHGKTGYPTIVFGEITLPKS